jgi:hypothetical protein
VPNGVGILNYVANRLTEGCSARRLLGSAACHWPRDLHRCTHSDELCARYVKVIDVDIAALPVSDEALG